MTGVAILIALSLLAARPAGAGELPLVVPTVAGVSVSANPVALGESVTLTAHIRERGTGAPVTAGLLALERAEAPEGPWVLLAQDPPDAQGTFELVDRVSPLTPGLVWFRARYLGHEGEGLSFAPALSPALPLVVKDYAGPPVELGVIHAAGDGEVGAHGLGAWELTVALKAGAELTEAVVRTVAAAEALAAPRRWRLPPLAAGEVHHLTIGLSDLAPGRSLAPGWAALTGEFQAWALLAAGARVLSDPAPAVSLALPEGLEASPPLPEPEGEP
jgi:hypothetical protein